MPSGLAPELRRLYLTLREHPSGMREYDLLERLRGAGPLRGLDALEMFRVHFLLFHHLHRLRRELERQRRGSLEIHCLRIRLQPLAGHHPNPDRLPLAPDPVAEYYLDSGHLVTTGREDVQALLRWFWRRYRVHGRREEALAELELGPGATPAEVRRRFRQLARAHHPDRGGNAERFHRLVEAAEVLRLHQNPPPGP
ncbi:MAG: DNA-J related domain-containing protein [Deferrisomatales bacterium]|nr:DNA-J related domain-containing protein [Deferrisomatales bacterium]